MSTSQHQTEHQEMFEKLNSMGSGFCLAKFYNLGLHLETGRAHSCIHPRAHLIPVEEIKNNYHALHNDRFKKSVRQEMLNGGRPKECGYCWRLEDANPDIFSDRIHFSMQYNPDPTLFSDIIDKKAEHDYYPKNLEISFSTTCNFKCSYCGPAVSSQWQKDLEKNGPYKHRLWSLEDMIKDNEMPINDRDHNPYVDAFWQWLPEAYPHLWSLRITGGEPLLNTNTFQVIDWIRNHKNKNLEFGINTNLGVPEILINRFIDQLVDLQKTKNAKSISVWTSGESVGRQFEYIRYGSHYETWKNNITKLLDSVSGLTVRVMTTCNVLSTVGYLDFLKDMQEIRIAYPDRFIVDSHTYLQYPRHLSIDILTADFLPMFQEQVDYVKQHYDKNSIFRADRMLKYFQSVIENPLPSVSVSRKMFAEFVVEYDRRTGTDFHAVFPELKDFLEFCRDHE